MMTVSIRMGHHNTEPKTWRHVIRKY
jgi:hypothetical protein